MDDHTREMKAVRRERRKRRRRTLTEKGLDLILVGMITFIAGFCAGVAWMTLAVR